MTADLKAYPAYKDTSSWLGLVPQGWEVRSLGSMSSSRSERRRPDLPLLSVVREKGVIPRSSMAEGENHNVIPEDLSNYKVVRQGDLVINKMKAWQGSLGIAPQEGIVSPAYYVYQLQGITQDFAHVLFRSRPYVAFFGRVSDGVRVGQWDLSIDGMKRIPVPIPSEDEQVAIVRYLDHANRKIKRYIRAKKKLIGLLNEQKQAIVRRAVIRGLNPDVKLKASGVEWVGDIPTSWHMRKLGQIARVFNGTTPSRMHSAYWDGGTIPWLSSGKVNDYVVETPSQLITERAYKESSVSIVPRGSVILGLVGQGKTRGMSAWLNIDACINQNLAAIVPGREVDGRYLQHILTAFYKNVRELGRGGNQEALNCDIVSRLRIPLPPLDEQIALRERVEREVDGIVRMQRRVEREIALVQEYRTRLVADVVTGKLDVREAAAKLPDLAPEAEPLDEVEDVLQDDSATEDELDEVAEAA